MRLMTAAPSNLSSADDRLKGLDFTSSRLPQSRFFVKFFPTFSNIKMLDNECGVARIAFGDERILKGAVR